jgi:hypothetical protein
MSDSVYESPQERTIKWQSILTAVLLLFLQGSLPANSQEEAAKVAQANLTSKPVLASPGEIKGRLLDLDGITSHFNIKVKLIRLPDQTVVAETVTDQVGRYSFPPIPAGEYNIQFGETAVRLLAAQGMPVQPINLVVPKFLVTAAPVPGVAAAAAATTTTWTSAAWAGGTVVVVGGGTVGVAAATGNLSNLGLDAIGLGDDDEEEEVTASPKKTLPPTPPPPPPTIP